MKKNLFYSFILVSVLAIGCKEEVIPDLVVSSTFAGDSNMLYATTTLSGANEVPAVTTTATGTAVASFNKTTKILTTTVTYADIIPTAWHIHKAAAGAAGGVVFNFGTAFSSPFTYTTPAALTDAQITDLTAGLNYVNIHSAKAAGGEIRGQLAFDVTKGTGTVAGSFNPTTKILTLTVTHAGITPTAWHIHKGAVGTAGPVVLDMGTTFTSPFSFTTAALTAEQEADLRAGLYYVNIHTKAAPGGEIRGQLTAK